MRYQLTFAASILMLSACQFTAASPDKAAVLLASDAVVMQELGAAISSMSGFSDVTLSASDFIQSSEVIIERKHQTNQYGELIQGRDLEIPHRFRLETNGTQCWLVHLNSGQRRLLNTARCQVK
ncbi:hypothetical protein H8K38_11180 [Undibacterium sp. FT79W]|uniref:hypothetical protein n=1 Tax=Undibacterium sp. FT79W TaxID=2762296 RepID=UPI00164A9B53|nr:hypothetical protein [Undibacterium sp. FT79W]MBC3878376.1 hypothetical protein [Undibacterium sp. FT79W]